METDSRSVSVQRVTDLEKSVTELTERLQTAEDKNIQDDKVISYLNKQLNTKAALPPSSATNPYSQKIAASRLGASNFELPSGNFSSIPKNHSTPINTDGILTVTPNVNEVNIRTNLSSGLHISDSKIAHLSNNSNTSNSSTTLPRPLSALKQSTITNQRY